MPGARVEGYERANLILVLVIVQAVQVLVLAVAVFLFFVVFGAVVMKDSVMEDWIGEGTHHLALLPNLSVELVQVSIFLAAFSGLYFTVVVVTDEAYRDQFFTGVKAELDRAVGVRAAYLAARRHRTARRRRPCGSTGRERPTSSPSSRFMTLPVSLRGRSSSTTTFRGTL